MTGAVAFREVGVGGRGYGQYPAARTCGRCGRDWVLMVDRVARTKQRTAACPECLVDLAKVGAEPAAITADPLPSLDLPPGDWLFHGACGNADPELFFPGSGRQGETSPADAALAICQGCAVLDECRAWSLATGQDYGVWGGLTAQQRSELRATR